MSALAENRRSVLAGHAHVLFALMLRDVRTRMGSAPAFLFVVAWPLSHILLLVAWHSFAGRMAPYGESNAVWSAVGVVTFLSFSYISRFTVLSLVSNKALLHFPAIGMLHIIVARGVLEVLNVSFVILVVWGLFAALGIEVDPLNPAGFAAALLSSMGIGVGVGICIGLIASSVPMTVTVYTVATIFLWLASGVLFVPSAVPERAQAFLWYHPLLHCVEWARVAYYADYPTTMLDRGYVVWWIIGSIFVGLGSERLFRGAFLRQ